MTTLGTIRANHLSLTCTACGHNALVAVAGLLVKLPPDTTVQQVRQQARCSRCKVKGMNDCQIIFVGGSCPCVRPRGRLSATMAKPSRTVTARQ